MNPSINNGINQPSYGGINPQVGGGMNQQISGGMNQQSYGEMISQNNASEQKSKGKHKGLIIIMVLALTSIIVGVVLWFTVFNGGAGAVTGVIDQVTYVKDASGRVKFIDGRFTDKKVTDMSSALAALNSLQDALGFEKVIREFKNKSVSENEGITYYRFGQYYHEIEVYGNDVIIAVDSDGNVLGMSGHYTPGIDVGVDARINEGEAKNVVLQHLGNNVEITQVKKYLYDDSGNYVLVYGIMGFNNDGYDEYLVSANDGEIIGSISLIEAVNEGEDDVVDIYQDSWDIYRNRAVEIEVEGLDSVEKLNVVTAVNPNKYQLIDPFNKVIINDGQVIGKDLLGMIRMQFGSRIMEGSVNGNKFIYDGDNQGGDLAESGVTALKYFGEIKSFYKDVLGRDSYDDLGSPAIIYVGVKENSLFDNEVLHNAAWVNPISTMIIGYKIDSDGKDVSYVKCKDIMAHEFTHGVVGNIVELNIIPNKKDRNRANEPGALSEAYADIIGSLIEGENWEMCEDIKLLRSLSDPKSINYPSEVGGDYYYPDYYIRQEGSLDKLLTTDEKKYDDAYSYYDMGGIHRNATVVGHAAYLMHTNGAFKDNMEMAKVWYNSLFELPSSADFEDCALAVIKTAKELGLSQGSIDIIKKAFYDTKMLKQIDTSVSGVIKTSQIPIVNATVLLKNKEDDKEYTFFTDGDGKFEGTVTMGTYVITVLREGFDSYESDISIMGETWLEITLSYERNESDFDSSACTDATCHMVKIYDFDPSGSSSNYTKYYVKHGEVIGSKQMDEIVNSFNGGFEGMTVRRDGNKIYLEAYGLSVPISYYYRGTNTEFDWDTPITEDIDLEVNIGLLDSLYNFLDFEY